MGENWKLYLRSIFSDDALKKLYELRKRQEPAGGMRSSMNMLVSLSLLFVVISVLVIVAVVPNDVRDYIKTRDSLKILDWPQLTITSSAQLPWNCKNTESCYQDISLQPMQETTLEAIDQIKPEEKPGSAVLLRFKIREDAFLAFESQRAVVISLPRYKFYEATTFIDGIRGQTFLLGDRIYQTVEVKSIKTEGILFDVLMRFEPEQRSFAGMRIAEGVMIASPSEYERMVTHINSSKNAGAGVIGMVAKIAIAMFCLLLFLIIDGSPDSLGLALFMGFEAAAMAIGEGWFLLGPFSGHKSAIINYCYQMGDITKLYFLWQLARVARKGATRWLVWGTIVSIPYGLFMEHAGHMGWSWVYQLPRARDTIVGLGGGLVCWRVAISLRGQKLHWRVVALLLAGLGGVLECVNSWIAHSILMGISPALQTIYTVVQGNIGYLFALSTFINISTLENRVKSLSNAESRAREFERELEIARMVQSSLLHPPKLPPGISLSCYQEAAQYVSGDTYFVNWDKVANRFTFMLNDVTGHGIQAALKASACNVLAKTLWGQFPPEKSHCPGWHLRRFDELSQELLVEHDRTPDFNSIIAAEFDINSGDLSIYRSNFSFPVIIHPRLATASVSEPVLGEFWQVGIITTPNQKIVTTALQQGAFVLFLSDGFLESSRDLKHFTTFLRQRLSAYDGELNVGVINEIALKFDGFAKPHRNVDDRTLLIFQWEFDAAEVRAPKKVL